MAQREKIVEHVSQMIASLGVKSVRMDDVAGSLGVSKRTLYEMFGDKEELLYECMIYRMTAINRDLEKYTAGCSNMLEVLLVSIMRLISNSQWSETEKRLQTNLKKFYPNVFERVQRAYIENGLSGLRRALDKCREDGYLDPNIDFELMTKMFFYTLGIVKSEHNIDLPEGVSRQEAFGCLVVNFIRGLASVKGLQIIDEILAREIPNERKTNSLV